MEKCAVCKQELNIFNAIEVNGGVYVHSGQCYDHYHMIGINESNGDLLESVELLL